MAPQRSANAAPVSFVPLLGPRSRFSGRRPRTGKCSYAHSIEFALLTTASACPGEEIRFVLVTPAKECVIDPVTALNPELTDLLVRLEQTDATKWQALQELGLDAAPTPARRKGGRGR